jgi:hypothetical protein
MDGLTSLALPLYIRYLFCFQPRRLGSFMADSTDRASTANEFPVEHFFSKAPVHYDARPHAKIHTHIEALYVLDGSPIISD